ncbi:DUF4139 domain-containing protein [Flavobacterium rhizosphaerae]|uniref:DUF4139 domain-containing protein n=1 Tax=Flavobacterium rhizosphaerae TaxID=3163298 RepID=A0ABW8YVF5_9FLAO
MRKLLILLSFAITSIALAQKPVFTTAKVTNATVYYNAAELTQHTSVTLPAGTSEIVVKNVANYINESTIQIGAPASLTVLSVQFTTNYISEYEPDESAPELKKVRDSINLVRKQIANITIQKSNEQKTIELLDKNQLVAGSTTGLSVAELTKLVDYYKAKRNELTANYNALNEKELQLSEILDALNTRLNTNTKREEEKTSNGKLVLQVMNDTPGNVPLDITYLATGAGWIPFYDLRAEDTSKPITMMYKAQVTQNTGVEWKKVKLTLSSGVPNQNSTAPLLSAWFLRYGALPLYSNTNGVLNTLQGRAAGVQIESQQLEEVVIRGYSSKREKYKDVGDYTEIIENQLNISFDIDIPYDISSNGKAHSVNLKEINLPANYRHYSAPRVDEEAYLLAEITDYSKYNLLPGEANIIFDGMYIGKTTINPNQTADTLNLSMGRDKRISIKREKVVDKSGTRFLSSYKEQTFTYETTIRNNKKETANLILKDQYPLSTDKDIEITLLKDDGASINTDTNIMTWELTLKPGETKKIRISYKVRYPKNKVIANL